MIELLFCLAGIALGILLGLIPGLHINSFLPLFAALSITSQQSFFFVISMSMAYVFSSSFPAILLGVPNEDTALNVLPGHRLVLEGNAYSALLISLASGVLALMLSVFFLAIFLNLLPPVYPLVQKAVPYVLALVLVMMALSDKKGAILVIGLSSVLGMMTFSSDSLLPILTGFFGLSTILLSLMNRTKVPAQILKPTIGLSLPNLSVISFSACFLSALFGFVPAISSSIVGTIGSFIRDFNSEEFLALLSATNVTYMVYSFFALMLINKTRSGSAVFLSQVIGNEGISLVLGIILLSGAISFIICLKLIGPVIKLYRRIDYLKLSLCSAILLVIINFILAGPFGLAILLASTSIGLLANGLGVKRINCMAALIVPTMLVLI